MHFEMDHILTPYELFPFLGCLTFVHSVFNTVVDEGNVILHYILILNMLLAALCSHSLSSYLACLVCPVVPSSSQYCIYLNAMCCKKIVSPFWNVEVTERTEVL
jgi:hypothetical protein